MKSWSDIRKTLEQDRLAPPLRGRVQYFITRYREAHDDHGRISIRVDGEEVFKSSIFDVFKLEQEIEHRMDEQYPGLTGRDRWSKENEQLITEGAASEHAFYYAFREYDACAWKRRDYEESDFQIFGISLYLCVAVPVFQ